MTDNLTIAAHIFTKEVNGVMVTILGSGHGDMSSNPGRD